MEHNHSGIRARFSGGPTGRDHAKDDQELPAKDTFRQKGEQRMETIQNPEKTDKTTSWTIMLYIAADDTLANFAVESLKKLSKSARAPADPGDVAKVVVAAQFSIDAPGGQSIPRYIFDKSSGENLDSSLEDTLIAPPDMSEPEALMSFLEWVYANEKCKSERYALILWSHGPELFLQPPPGRPTGDPASLYLTPTDLSQVLKSWEASAGRHLEIIGFDACCMSMLEMACELNGLADFMIASQEDVPDLSFPYDILIELFRKYGNDALPTLLSEGIKAYVSTYQGCICNSNTGMKGVTLSVLNLAKCDALKEAVLKLACALLKAKDDKDLPDVLIKARSQSQDFAGGLYVDLYDFCAKLSELLGTENRFGSVKTACEKVLDLLRKGSPEVSGTATGDKPPDPVMLKNSHTNRGDRGWDSAILANSGDIEDDGPPHAVSVTLHSTEDDGSANRQRSHGISIYLPYLTDGQYATVSRPLVKGEFGTRGGKGYTEMLNGATAEYLMCARRELILITESYYEGLQLAQTGWYDVIADVWTKALIKKFPKDLDYQYSAQQSWVNVCRKTIFGKVPRLPPNCKTNLKQ